MPKAAKSKSKAKPAANKKAAPKKQDTAKAKVIYNTDDGTPIVNGKSKKSVGMYEDMFFCVFLIFVSCGYDNL